MANRIIKDRYEIIAELGKGGMSTVYLARDRILGSYWAVKQVKKNASNDIGAFKKEVELLSSLNHSDIPRIVDRIEIDDDYFVCMDFVDGVALSKKVKSEGPLPEKEAVQYTLMLCDVLEYLHTAKDNPIVYRDIKPENIMLTPNGRIKLIDFGIAKECVRGQQDKGPKVGTKGYAAPEQYAGGPLDERTDIYSVGVTIFTLVTGKAPAKPMKKGQVVTVPPIREVNPGLSEGLEYIVEKCTAVDPNNRYQNCAELRHDLENIEKLNSQYRKSMGGKLAAFAGCLVICAVSLLFMFIGGNGIQQEKSDNYQYAYNQAISHEKKKEYSQAREWYMRAAAYKEDDPTAYIGAFKCDLTVDETGETTSDVEAVIDSYKNIIDDRYSKVYRNAKLMYTVAKQCLTVNDPVYAGYASQYFSLIKETAEYGEGGFSKTEIDSLYILSEMQSRDWSSIEAESFRQAMDQLEKDTDESPNMDSNERISNYYNLIIIYNAYQDKFADSYSKIDELGEKADDVFNSQLETEELEFVHIADLYKLVVKSQYNNSIYSGFGATEESKEESREKYINTIKWFTYLEDLNISLDNDLEIKKGNSYRSIFETYLNDITQIDDKARAYLEQAISIYEGVIARSPDNFTAAVHLTNALISREQGKVDPAARDFTKVKTQFQRVEAMHAAGNLTATENKLYSSLKTNYEQAVQEGPAA